MTDSTARHKWNAHAVASSYARHRPASCKSALAALEDPPRFQAEDVFQRAQSNHLYRICLFRNDIGCNSRHIIPQDRPKFSKCIRNLRSTMPLELCVLVNFQNLIISSGNTPFMAASSCFAARRAAGSKGESSSVILISSSLANHKAPTLTEIFESGWMEDKGLRTAPKLYMSCKFSFFKTRPLARLLGTRILHYHYHFGYAKYNIAK